KNAIASTLSDASDFLPEPLRAQTAAFAALRRDKLKNPAAKHAPPQFAPANGRMFDDFNRDDWGTWYVAGDAFGDRPCRAGDFRVALDGPSPRLIAIGAGAAHSGLVSNRLHGVLRSPTFTIDTRYIHYLAAGTGGRISVVIDGFEKIRTPIYGGLTTVVNTGDSPRWLTQNVAMWLGHSAYLEIADGATVDFSAGTSHIDDGQGYIAVDEIRMSNAAAAPAGPAISPPVAIDLGAAITALRPAHPEQAKCLESALAEFRAVEAQLPQPTLALAIADG